MSNRVTQSKPAAGDIFTKSTGGVWPQWEISQQGLNNSTQKVSQKKRPSLALFSQRMVAEDDKGLSSCNQGNI